MNGWPNGAAGAGVAMRDRLFALWRLIATGLCFVMFGAGGVVLRFAVFPLLALMVRNKVRRVALARTTIRLAFQWFVGMMRDFGVLRVEISGRQRLERQGLLILANHPSLIDTVFLMALVKNADCILKADLQTNFFTRGPVRAADYIFNDQGMELVHDCVASLKQGSNLIIFPEGTRTPAHGEIQLKRGAANIAVRSGCNITPVIIDCQPKTLGKGDKWWSIPSRTVSFKIMVQEDIDISRFMKDSVSEAVAARHLTAYLASYFTEETQRHA
ncbi:1-acyl-sn-glycerol-3-phosphate acyltransferase [Oxalobacteraceae bacterium GrIS 2.11]